MRELKDYFCNAEQSKELIELGFSGAVLAVHLGSNLRQIPLAYNLNAHEIKAPLRSQALDYFRDLGYMPQIRGIKDKWYVIDKVDSSKMPITADKNYQTYNEAESALIDKLIELEKEARNGD